MMIMMFRFNDMKIRYLNLNRLQGDGSQGKKGNQKGAELKGIDYQGWNSRGKQYLITNKLL